MINRTIVVLANSVKHHQHCVAGKCIVSGEWIRPVSNIQGAELSNSQVQYSNQYGTYSAKVLQKMEMSFTSHVPLLNQPENHLISGNLWKQRYKIDEHELLELLDYPDDLWGAGDSVIYRFITSGAVNIPQSLYLVAVENLRLYRNHRNKRRGSFSYNGINYDFAVTDPRFDQLTGGEENLQGILCISLGEHFEEQGKCYKLIASIF